MRKIFRCTLRALVVPLLWSAQSAAALSLLDVIEMSRGGYSEEEIGRIIEVTGARFEIDSVGLVALGEADVPVAVIDRMLDEGGMPPTEVSEVSASEILELHEAGFSDGTILKFVRHRNVCTPLSEDGVELLVREEFAPEFLDGFSELVAACERERVAREPIEPLPETAYADGAPADAGDPHGASQPVYQNTYHYDQHYYERPYHDHHFGGHYHPAYVYSYYHYDPLRRVYPIYIYRDHRDRGDRKRRGDRRRADGPPRDRGRGEAARRPGGPATAPGAVPARVPGSAPGEGSRLFDEPRPVMSGRPGGGGGGSRPGGKSAPRSPSEPAVPGRPLLRGTLVTNGVAERPGDAPAPATTPANVGSPARPSVPAMRPAPGARAGLPLERLQRRPTGGVAVPDVARPDRPPSTRPVRAVSAPRSGGQAPAVPSAPRTAREAIPVRRRVVAPNRVTPRPTPARPPATATTPRAASRPERVSPARTATPRSVTPTRTPRPRAVAPRSTAPRAVTPRPAPRATTPRAVTPRAVAPRPAAPRAVAPRTVTPRSAPRTVAPRIVTPPDGRPSSRATQGCASCGRSPAGAAGGCPAGGRSAARPACVGAPRSGPATGGAAPRPAAGVATAGAPLGALIPVPTVGSGGCSRMAPSAQAGVV